MPKTIFISISNPISIRNFLLIPDGVLYKLKKSGARIVILVINDAYDAVKKDFESDNVIVEPVTVSWKRNFFQKTVEFFTSYLTFTELARLESTMGVRIDVKPSRARKYTYFLKPMIAKTLGKIDFVKTYVAPKLDMLSFRERPYRNLFDKYKPSAVFVPDIFSLQGRNTLREARRQGVHSVGMTLSWDHFPKRFEPVKPDTLLVWNEVLKKEAVKLQSYRKDKIFVTGVPQYDLFTQKNLFISKEELFDKLGFDKNKKLISFFSSSKRAPDDADIADMILKSIKDKKLPADAQLFIRPYPGATTDHEKFDRFNGETQVYVDWVEIRKIFRDSSHGWYPSLNGVVNIMNVLYHSDVVISTYSSVSVEASIFLKPSININFDGYKKRPFNQSIKRSKFKSHFKHVLGTGGVKQAENAEDLFKFLNEFLVNPDANKENILKLRDKMCYKADGKSSVRIANHILDYL